MTLTMAEAIHDVDEMPAPALSDGCRILSAISVERAQHSIEANAGQAAGTLIFMATGMLLVTIDGELWPMLPQRALWIPPHASYQMHCRSDATLHVLKIAAAPTLPASPAVITALPLFRELVLEAVRLSSDGASSAEWAWIEPLILSRIVNQPERRGKMRAPSDPRLQRICNEIIANPSNNRTIDEWAAEVGMSRRTLTRHFRDETGLSFSMWRQQARLQEAIARLEMGQPITSIAFDIGYESPASFSNVFRQTFGTSPSRFLGGG